MEFKGPSFTVQMIDRDKYRYRDGYTAITGTKAEIENLILTKRETALDFSEKLGECYAMLRNTQAPKLPEPTRFPPGASGVYPKPTPKAEVVVEEDVEEEVVTLRPPAKPEKKKIEKKVPMKPAAKAVKAKSEPKSAASSFLDSLRAAAASKKVARK